VKRPERPAFCGGWIKSRVIRLLFPGSETTPVSPGFTGGKSQVERRARRVVNLDEYRLTRAPKDLDGKPVRGGAA
jgi:hypothetical protein